jgi:hypothetical protein
MPSASVPLGIAAPHQSRKLPSIVLGNQRLKQRLALDVRQPQDVPTIMAQERSKA